MMDQSVFKGMFGAVLALSLSACGSSDSKTPDEGTPDDGTVTWSKDIAPLVNEKCVGCHHDGGIAPFSMERYTDVVPYAGLMAKETEEGTMPPWLAEDTDECVPRFGWKNDIRLTADQKALIRAWADDEAPEGDAQHASALTAPTELSIDDPDLTLVIPKAVEVDGDRDEFWCFVIETGLEETRYFNSVQINAGNPAVVHHVLVYNDVNAALTPERIAEQKYECFGGTGVNGAQLVTAWAPGGVPNTTPPDVAYELEAGTRLVVQVHYHPTGTNEVDDATSIDFKLAPGTPKYRATTSLIGNFVSPSVIAGGLLPGTNDPEAELEFMIPAGAKEHVESMVSTVSTEMRIYGVGTHMHYVGRDQVIHLKHAAPADGEPEQECLIQTPRWDFNWQRGYAYDTPLDEVPVARPGDQLLFSCRYDNSMDNPFVREALEQQGLSAPRDVHLGEETLDEMCLGAFAVATPIVTE
jgi:hypothetical protein